MVIEVSCTKSQLLALLTRIKKDIENSKNTECTKRVVESYRQPIEEHAMSEVWKEIVRP